MPRAWNWANRIFRQTCGPGGWPGPHLFWSLVVGFRPSALDIPFFLSPEVLRACLGPGSLEVINLRSHSRHYFLSLLTFAFHSLNIICGLRVCISAAEKS